MSFDSLSLADCGASSDLDDEARTVDCVSPVLGGIEGFKAVTRRRVRIPAPVVPLHPGHARRDDSALFVIRRWARRAEEKLQNVRRQCADRCPNEHQSTHHGGRTNYRVRQSLRSNGTCLHHGVASSARDVWRLHDRRLLGVTRSLDGVSVRSGVVDSVTDEGSLSAVNR